MARKLGKTQAAFLKAMLDHYGQWHANCGWYWDNFSGTRRLCESLEQRGLLRSEEIESRRGMNKRWVVIDREAAKDAIKKAKEACRAAQDQVAEKMQELGLCEWADSFKQRYQCDGGTK